MCGMKKKGAKKKPVGRPRGTTKNNALNAHIQIRLAAADKDTYKHAAKNAGISLSEWVKRACDEKLSG